MAEQVMDDQGVLREIVSRKEAIERGLGRYFTGKKCKWGHLSERDVGNKHCRVCKKEYQKEYRKENKDRIKEYQKEYNKEYYEENKDRIKEYQRENKDRIKEYQKEYMKEYMKENKDKILKYKKEYHKDRYANDPDFRTARICRRILHRTLKATSSTKDTQTYEALGYCNEELKQNIESKFLQGMSWENYGEWHIDHKYPVSRYIQDGITDPKIINSLDNLIPMWDDHNMSKSAMTLEEFIEHDEEMSEMYGEFLETV